MKVEKVPDSTYDMIGGCDQQIKEIKEVGSGVECSRAAGSSSSEGDNSSTSSNRAAIRAFLQGQTLQQQTNEGLRNSVELQAYCNNRLI
jgi:hypothetical protein